MEEKTREELVAEFAKKIFDESYFSVFSDEDVFYQAANFLEENDIPVSELDKEIKKLHTEYRGSRPRAKDNVFDIIGDEFSSADVGKAREAFKFDIPKEVKQRAEDKKAEEQAEAAEQEQPVAEEVANNKPAPAPAPAPARAPAPAQQAPKPNLDNPTGLLAAMNNMQKQDPDNLTVDNIANMGKAEARRQIQNQIESRRRADRIQKIFDDREADLKESWARSRTGRMDGRSWDQLDEETKSEMRGRFMDARANSAYTDEKYKAYKEKTKDPLEKEYERKLKALQESRAMPPQDPFTEETKTDAMFIAPRQADLLLAEDPNANTPATRSEKSIGQSILDAREDVLRSEAASRPPNTVDTSLRDAARAERENVFREKYANNPARVQREAREAQLRGLSSPRAERDSRYQLPAYSQQTLEAPAPAPFSSATSNGFSLNTKDSPAPDPKEKAFADLEEAKQAEGLRSQIADIRGQIQNQQDILDLKNKADRELDARYATENAAKAARNAAYIEAQRMAKEKNVADTKNYYNQQVPVYGRRNDGTLGLMYDPNSYKAMKERSQVMGGIQNSKSGDPMADWQKEEEEKRRRKNQNIFG